MGETEAGLGWVPGLGVECCNNRGQGVHGEECV